MASPRAAAPGQIGTRVKRGTTGIAASRPAAPRSSREDTAGAPHRAIDPQPLTAAERRNRYRRQTGRVELTPRQRRRVDHKIGHAARRGILW